MKKRIFCLILVAFLAASALCVFAACNNKVELPEENNAINEGNNESLMFASRNENQHMTIRKVATSSETTAQTLSVTLSPAGQTGVVLDWSMAWKNASSTWASGKTVTDYVSLSVATDTLSATVNCKAAFGEQIVVTVTALDNPNAKASCTIDYRKRINVSVVMTATDGTSVTLDETQKSNTSNLATLVAGKTYTANVNVTEDVGTVGSYTVATSQGGFVSNFTKLTGLVAACQSKINSGFSASDFNTSSYLALSNKVTSVKISKSEIASWLYTSDWVEENEFDDEIAAVAIDCMNSVGTKTHLGCWRVVVKNEQNVTALDTYFYFAIDVSAIRVTGITLNNTSITF